MNNYLNNEDDPVVYEISEDEIKEKKRHKRGTTRLLCKKPRVTNVECNQNEQDEAKPKSKYGDDEKLMTPVSTPAPMSSTKSSPHKHTVPLVPKDSSVVKKKYSTSEEFRVIRNTHTFIDKTLLIKDLFEEGECVDEPVVLVTAPRRFGKSVNLNMIKNFLGKQVNQDTGDEIPSNHQGSNAASFVDTEIMKHKDFVNRYFGKYAIIRCNFLCCEAITNQQEALDFYKNIINEAYLEHYYLCNSSRLNEEEQKICRQWCDEHNCLMQRDGNVSKALKRLSKYLWKHYEEKLKIFVLVDEYDSVFYKAMKYVKNKDSLHKIIDCGIAMLCNLVKGNPYVSGAFLTGISHVAGLRLSSALGHVSSHRFLKKDNKFIAYYGFSESEVDNLFKNCNIPLEQQESARKFYNGFLSEDGKHSLYNPWSVIFFIKSRTINTYWVNSGAIEGLNSAFHINKIKTEIEKALYSGVTNGITPLDKMEQDNFYQLHALIHGEGNHEPSIQLFLTFLLEQGYLGYTNKRDLKIPNQEIKIELHRKLGKHFTESYGIIELDQIALKMSFLSLFSSQTDLTMLISNLRDKLQTYVVPLKENKTTLNHYILQQILFVPLFETKYVLLTETKTKENKRTDFFLYKKDHGVIIELKYMQNNDSANSSKEALRQILERRYYVLFGDDRYFKDFAKRFHLIGLSFNSKLEVSLHCLHNSNVSACEHFTTEEGLGKTLTKDDIEELLTKANVDSLNST